MCSVITNNKIFVNDCETGTYDELLRKNGHFAQLIKLFKSEAEEQEKKEHGSKSSDASPPAGKTQTPKASPAKTPKQAAAADQLATPESVSQTQEPALTPITESTSNEAPKGGEGEEKTEINKAKLMTDEDSASGTDLLSI